MRASPRTWPSIRFSRFSAVALGLLSHDRYIPLRGIGFKRTHEWHEQSSRARSRPRRPRRRRRARSGLRHDGRSAHRQASPPAPGPCLLLLLGRLPHQVRRRSGEVSEQGRTRRRAGAGRRDLHLPDASRDPPGRSRLLPDLRHGAGARARDRRHRPEPRARRHDAGASGSASCSRSRCSRSRWARISSAATASSIRRSRTGSSSRSRRRWCCGPAGRSSCAAAQSVVTRNLNMFTLIAMGTGVAYALQRGRDRRARRFSGRLPRPFRRGRGLFRGRRRHHGAGAARPGAGAARARGRPPARSAR